MPEGRARWYTKALYNVDCHDCNWELWGVSTGLGLAAQHHDRTGHVVRVEVLLTHVYGEDRPGQRRWWKAP